MTTFWDGVKVPETIIEYFSGTTNASGYLDCTLAYTPTSAFEITVSVRGGSGYYFYGCTLSGKVLSVYIGKYVYEKADTPSQNANSGGAGADPHGHVIGHTTTDVATALTNGDAVTFSVNYKPARS